MPPMARAAERIASDLLSAGWARLADGEWGAAKASFEGALAGEESPEALEGLSWAAWCLDDATPCGSSTACCRPERTRPG